MDPSGKYYVHKGNVMISKKCIIECYHHVSINGVFEKMSKDGIRALAKKRRIVLAEHFDLVKIKVSPVCSQSFPCKHRVSVKEKTAQILTAPQIKKLYIRFGLEVPDHFKSF